MLDVASGALCLIAFVCFCASVCLCVRARTRFLKLGTKIKGNQASNRNPTSCSHSYQEETRAATVVAKEACGRAGEREEAVSHDLLSHVTFAEG